MADNTVLDPRAKDLTGRRFGILTATRPTDQRDRNLYIVWECRCECGAVTRVSSKNLLRGSATTCGCRAIPRATLKGREYRIWTDMKTRCYNPNSNRYVRYGARGVRVCDRWLNDFHAFLSDMGPCPPGMSIDRYPDNDGNYEPGNCRWASPSQQTKNSGRARMLTFQGRTQCLADWATELGIPQDRLQARLSQLGWSVERALTTGKRINKYA